MADTDPTRREPTPPRGTTQYRRADHLARERSRWPVVLGLIVIATVLGAAAGLLVPAGRTDRAERSGWHLPSLPLPPLPWQTGGPVDQQVAAQALALPWGAAPEPLRARLAPEPVPSLVPPAPLRRFDTPAETSAFRTAAVPLLGPDPLGLTWWQERSRYDRSLAPRGIDPMARLATVPVMMYHDVVAGEPDVWFDLRIEDFDRDLAKIAEAGATPISLRQWWGYITRGEALPPKPILLTFDDGYSSVYELIYPRLKQRNWPAVFFIVPSTVGRKTGKDHLTWDQMREMHATGLYEFQAHSMTHPYLTQVSDEQLQQEVFSSRDELERELGVPVQFFCYPIGDRDGRVIQMLKNAGFVAGFTMTAGGSAQSPGIMEVNRYPNQEIDRALEELNGAITLAAPPMWPKADLTQPVTFHRQTFNEGGNRIPVCWVTGGRVTTVHADFRYAVGDVARLAGAPAGINGGFFQLAHVRDVSNAMLGPVMAARTTERDEAMWAARTVAEPARLLGYDRFVPGAENDNQRLAGRPLVLISPTGLRFVPFRPEMNSRRAFELLLPGATDAFVGGGWLVRDGKALSLSELDSAATRDHNDFRRRAFFGIDRAGRPVIGASPSSQRSEVIARCLQDIGLAHAVLLDSGFSSSLYYNGSLFVTGHSDEKPSRPVPHIILLERPDDASVRPLGHAASKVESLLRWAAGDEQSDEMPPHARLVDVPQLGPEIGADEY